MTPSAAPVTSRFPLWLKAVQLTATGSGSKENWSCDTEEMVLKRKSRENVSRLLLSSWFPTCCLTVLVSQRSSFPNTGSGSRGAASTYPGRVTAAAEQTNDEPLGLHAKDNILRERGESYKSILWYVVLCKVVSLGLRFLWANVEKAAHSLH